MGRAEQGRCLKGGGEGSIPMQDWQIPKWILESICIFINGDLVWAVEAGVGSREHTLGRRWSGRGGKLNHPSILEPKKGKIIPENGEGIRLGRRAKE